MQFWTTPKGKIPHYVFIYRKTGLLMTELKNTACYRFVTMLYIELKRGKDKICCTLHNIKVWNDMLTTNKINYVDKVVFGLVSFRIPFTLYP